MIIPYVNQSLPLDQLKDAPAAAAYGLRRLKSGYKGNCIIVRRDNDNAELAIPFCGQDLCLSTLRAFVTTNSGFVTTWYDQSGNAYHVTQTDTTKQPRIVNAGVVDDGIYFDGANYFFDSGSADLGIATTDIITINTVIKPSAHSATGFLVNDYNNTTGWYFSCTTTNSARVANTTTGNSRIVTATAFTPDNKYIYTGNIFPNTTAANIYTNGTLDNATPGAVGNPNQLYQSASNVMVGKLSSGASNYYKGNLNELIIFRTQVSTVQRQKLERNQGKYNGIGVV